MVQPGGHGAVVGERHHEPELFRHRVFGLGVRFEFGADGVGDDFRDADWERGDGEFFFRGANEWVGWGVVEIVF